MSILITPESAVCGGKSCYAFPNGDPAYNHTCPGNSIIISIGGSGNVIQPDTSDTIIECVDAQTCDSYDFGSQYIPSSGPNSGDNCTVIACSQGNPDIPSHECYDAEEYYVLELNCNSCEGEESTKTYTIDPNDNTFNNALGWKLVSCASDPSVTRSAVAYITGGSWYHACIDPSGNLSFGGQLNEDFSLPFFPNGNAQFGNNIHCSVVAKNGSCSTLVMSPGVSSEFEDELCTGENPTGKSCVEVYVHPDAGVFSPDEVFRNIECLSQTADGSIVSSLLYPNIAKDAAIFDPRGVLFRSNNAFTVTINYDTVTCGDPSTMQHCTGGLGIKALRLSTNARTCNILDEDPVKVIQNI